MRLFVFGLGYSASAVVERARPRLSWIGGTVREAAKAAEWRQAGIEASIFDASVSGPEVAGRLAETTHLLMSVPPGEHDPVLAHHRPDILAAPALSWIGYLSTVGVYGDHGGEWVDEGSPCRPGQPRSQQRLHAEAGWSDLAAQKDVPLAIFRLAGIYGPARNALANLADGTAHRIVKPGQVFNRIHVEDIAAAVDAALARNADGIFNIADDEPCPPQDVVAYAAALMGVDSPPEIPLAEANLSPMGRSFYGENKRVSNRRIKESLGVSLAYPTYREGLGELWRNGLWR